MKKFLSALLVLTMLAALLAGCGSQTAAETTAADETSAAASEAAGTGTAETASAEEGASAEPTVTAEKASYPLCDPDAETLTLWIEFPGFLQAMGVLNSFTDHPAFQKAEEITGVKIDYTEVSMMNESEQFTLMCASQSMTDLVSSGVKLYSGGSSKIIEDEILIDMAPYAQQYMGNYMDTLSQYPEYKQMAYNDDGEMAECITITDEYYPGAGPQIRQDWLDQLGLDTPKTYDQLHDVLTAFKTISTCTTPLLLLGQTQAGNYGLVGGYNTAGAAETTTNSSNTVNMYVVDGTIHNGYQDESYKEYLQMLNQWYNEGLIASDFYSQSSDANANGTDAYVLSGETGMWYAQSNFIGDYENKATDSSFKVSGIPETVQEEGDGWHFATDVNTSSGSNIGISTNCKNVELACKWLDFWFSEQGVTLANYGVEGQSYELDANGDPQFTDLLTNSTEGLSFQFALAKYCCGSNVPTLNHYTKTWSQYTEDTVNAMKLWKENEDSEYYLPSGLSLNTEESEEYASTFSDINTHANENIPKFVMGTRSFDEWDTFVGELNSMGLDRCVEIYQEAYDRYAARVAQTA